MVLLYFTRAFADVVESCRRHCKRWETFGAVFWSTCCYGFSSFALASLLEFHLRFVPWLLLIDVIQSKESVHNCFSEKLQLKLFCKPFILLSFFFFYMEAWTLKCQKHEQFVFLLALWISFMLCVYIVCVCVCVCVCCMHTCECVCMCERDSIPQNDLKK